MFDDIGDFARVVASYTHARVAHVGEAGDGGVEVVLGEVLGEHQEGSADGGDEVDLVGEADGGVVAQDLDWFLQTASDVHGVPFGEVFAEGVEVDDAVFDEDAVDGDVGVEVDAGTD